MQFLRTLFWVVLAVVAVVFAINNWTPVTIRLWSDIVLDTRLPVLMIVTFLLGLVPALILYRTTRWSLNRKLDVAQRAAPPVLTPQVYRSDGIPPGGSPIIPPAGVA